MDEQKAAHVTWKTSIVPHSAGNRTEPDVADPREIERIIDDPNSLRPPEPLESSELLKPEGLDPAPRYNANVPYAPQPVQHDHNDLILIQAVKQAVKNGWKDYHRFANDATTIGLEGEAVVKGMQKQKLDVKKLIFDKDFCRAFFGEDWKEGLLEMVWSDNPILVIKEHLEDRREL